MGYHQGLENHSKIWHSWQLFHRGVGWKGTKVTRAQRKLLLLCSLLDVMSKIVSPTNSCVEVLAPRTPEVAFGNRLVVGVIS